MNGIRILSGSSSAPALLSQRRGGGLARTAALSVAACLAGQAGMAQTWVPVTNAPAAVGLMLLLLDGTVMCSQQDGSAIGSAWWKLTPSAAGSYAAGTWSAMAAMPNTRLYFQTQVLLDGRVYCSGGEYGTGGPIASVYNPQTNVWTTLTIPGSLWNGSCNFYDCNSEILPDGQVLLMPVFPLSGGAAMRYNPATNVWSSGGHLFRGTYQDEASWVKLPDDSILTIDPFGTNSERYIPSTNTWINDGVVPVSLYDPYGSELGGASFLPNGKAFFLGSTGQTALYTPSGTTSPGVWTVGPVIPGSHGTPDAPAAMMVNGKILCAVSPVPTSANHFPTPTTFYEYDPNATPIGGFTATSAPVGSSDPISSYKAMMLCLPNGQIMYTHMGTTVYVYTPAGAPLAAGKPTISSITSNGDGSFHMTGTLLNGICEGACYGDDWQMNTNYPIVRLNHSNGNIYYARSYNRSSTSVATGSAILTTEFLPPASMPAGAYTVTVIANGNASDPFSNSCYPNCDNSTTPPILNVLDFTCFLNKFAAGDTYANCDASSSPPVLNVLDFTCFLNAFAAGCS